MIIAVKQQNAPKYLFLLKGFSLSDEDGRPVGV